MKKDTQNNSHLDKVTESHVYTWKNKKMLVLGIVVLIGVIAVIVIFLFQESKPEPIKIGALLAMTGAGGDSGRLLLDGMNLVIDDLNILKILQCRFSICNIFFQLLIR